MKSKTLSRICKMMKPQKKAIAIISILSIIINVGEIVKPYLIKVVIDNFLSMGLWQKGVVTVGIIGGIYVAIVLIGNILDFIVSTTTSMIGENVIYSIRNKLYRYIQYADISFHDRTPSGTLFVRITSDVEDITTFFKDMILIIAIITIMVYFSAKLSLLAFIVIPFVIIFSIVLTKILYVFC